MFVLFTPAHNEREQVEGLVACVRASTLRPDVWVVIDDASTDGTADAFTSLGADLPIRVVPSGAGGGYMGFRIAEVLQAGARACPEVEDATLVGVLDADIRVGPRYWEALAEMVERTPGIASGALCSKDGSERWRLEAGQRVDLPRGGLRLISGDVFRKVGGFATSRSWDSVMTVQARLSGAEVRLVPDLLAVSTRPTDSRSVDEAGWMSRGRRAYNLGQPGWQVAVRAAAMTVRGRPGAGSALMRGYLDERGGPRIDDASVVAYYRRERPREWARSLLSIAGRRNPYRYLRPRSVDPAELADIPLV